MLKVCHPSETFVVGNGALRQLLLSRFSEVSGGEDYDPGVFGHFLVAQIGDQIEDIESATGRPMNAPTDLAIVPAWECIVDHPTCYEMIFVLHDSGYGVLVFIPKDNSIDERLLQLCWRHAVQESTDRS